MSDRAAHLALAAMTLALVVGASTARLPAFWGDASTYYSMALSVAEDFDLRYEARDLLRVRREYASGPQGIFLKRASGGLAWQPERGFPWLHKVPPDQPRIYFAKALTYPLVAAPLVALIGPRGLLVTNALAFGATLALAFVVLRKQTSPARALFTVLVLIGATVAPVYVLWRMPEVLTMALVMGALAAWGAGRPTLAAVLFGIAAYTKPYNIVVALPLGIAPLLAWRSGWRMALWESVRRGLVLAAVVVALFGLNAAITGEINYQGGERKTFIWRFPEEMTAEGNQVTFGNSGEWMTTDQLGPLVEGRDEASMSRRTGPLRAPEEIRASFFRNLAYFWIGRFGGAFPYFPPAVAALAVFLALGPRTREGWLALAAMLCSWLFYIRMIPDNWYGGGGTLGNRYFLNLLPLVVWLVPKGRELLVSVASLALALPLLGPIWRSPLHHSLRPGDHASARVFRALPAELTMLNDLGTSTEAWRKKQPFGDTEGDAHKHWPADPKAYYLYFMADGTWGKETLEGVEGFWLRGGGDAEVVLRALEPVRVIRVRARGGPAGDRVTAEVAGRKQVIEVGPGQVGEATIAVPSGGFAYYDTFLHVVRLRSERGAAAPAPETNPRHLGAFVSIALEVDRRPRRP